LTSDINEVRVKEKQLFFLNLFIDPSAN